MSFRSLGRRFQVDDDALDSNRLIGDRDDHASDQVMLMGDAVGINPGEVFDAPAVPETVARHGTRCPWRPGPARRAIRARPEYAVDPLRRRELRAPPPGTGCSTVRTVQNRSA